MRRVASPTVTDQLRCAHCGDVIGIYEPLVAIDDGGVRETSCAAEADLTPLDGTHLHRTCYPSWRDAPADAR